MNQVIIIGDNDEGKGTSNNRTIERKEEKGNADTHKNTEGVRKADTSIKVTSRIDKNEGMGVIKMSGAEEVDESNENKEGKKLMKTSKTAQAALVKVSAEIMKIAQSVPMKVMDR